MIIFEKLTLPHQTRGELWSQMCGLKSQLSTIYGCKSHSPHLQNGANNSTLLPVIAMRIEQDKDATCKVPGTWLVLNGCHCCWDR